MTVIAALAVLPAGIILWNLFALSRSTRAFIANTEPVRQLSDEERAALAFMVSRKISFTHFAGVTALPIGKLQTAQGRAAAVYQLRGPLQISGYTTQWGGEVHYSIENVEVYMANSQLSDFMTEYNVVEVVFCKKVGIVLSCNDTYSMVDVSNAMKARWDSPEMQE